MSLLEEIPLVCEDFPASDVVGVHLSGAAGVAGIVAGVCLGEQFL